MAPTQQSVLKQVLRALSSAVLRVGAVDVACRAVQIYLTPAERTHPKEAMDQVMAFIDPFKQLSKDSIRLIKRCTKPDRKEFQKIAMATAIGFAIMGFIGFFVKLIHIPINNIIV